MAIITWRVMKMNHRLNDLIEHSLRLEVVTLHVIYLKLETLAADNALQDIEESGCEPWQDGVQQERLTDDRV